MREPVLPHDPVTDPDEPVAPLEPFGDDLAARRQSQDTTPRRDGRAPVHVPPRAVREWVLSFGPLAPVSFVALQAAQVVFAPPLGQVLGFAGGYLFGALKGTALSLLGATIGSVVAFVAARRLGWPFVEDVLADGVVETVDDLVARDGVVVLFAVFLVPGLPDDAICLLAGLTAVPVWQLTAVTVLGRLPGYLVVAYAGDRAASASLVESAVVLGVFAVLALVAYRKRDAILARLGRPAAPLSPRHRVAFTVRR